jgi:mannose-6-phosphate isomerase-like protein (cupin superfamily)
MSVPGRNQFIFTLLPLAFAVGWTIQSGDGRVPLPANGATPLFLEKDQGESRTRRITGNQMVAAKFILKVSPKNNGSQHLVLGTEELVEGSTIGTHKHLGPDEIVIVESGSVHATVGDVQGDAHAGGLVFIPSDSWVTIKNTNNGPTNIVFLFSEPGFDDYMRCVSVADSEPATNLSRDERKTCAHNGHVIFKSLEDPPKN